MNVRRDEERNGAEIFVVLSLFSPATSFVLLALPPFHVLFLPFLSFPKEQWREGRSAER